MALSKSAQFYRKNKKSREKKKAYDKKLNSKKEQIQKRVESNRARRKAKAAGKNVKNKDWDHKTGRFISVKANRGRVGEGGRKRKKGGAVRKKK